MINKHFKLKCLCATILIAFSLVSVTGTYGSSSSRSSHSRQSSSVGGNFDRVVSARSLSTGANREDDENENESENAVEPAGKKFTWDIHPEDHGIYAHRSLMSAENVKSPQDQDQDQNSAGSLVDPDTQHNRSPSPAFDDYEPLKTKDYAEKEWQLMFRSIDLIFDNLLNSLKPTQSESGKQKLGFFDEIVSRLKPECRRDIHHIKQSIKKHKLWALRMLDSNGKLPSGVTYGRFSSPGDYEECLGVSVDETVYRRAGSESLSSNSGSDQNTNLVQERHKFNGKYCLLDFRLPLPERPRDKLLSIHDPVVDLGKTEIATMFPSIKNYSGYASMFYEVGYMHGVCLPSTCDIKDLTRSVGIALEGLYIIVNNTVDCEEKLESSPPLTRSQLISSTLLVLLFVNAFAATVIHHLLAKEKKKKAKESRKMSAGSASNQKQASQGSGWVDKPQYSVYSSCFSIQTNFERLTKPDPRGLTFVHYTRIVAMALTVITHTAAMGTLQAITKPADASNNEQIFRDFLPQMLANAFSSIQIFFFMAGFMLVISTYPSIKRERGHISFLEYAIKRAIRLMPGLAATIALNFLWPLFSEGPMLTYFKRMIVEPCETNWWRTLGFLSNFDHVEKMCIRHSYFSASDYQLHLMAFPLLILLHKQPHLSLFIAGLLTVVGFAAQVIVILTKTVLPFMMVDYIDKEAFFNVVHYIHHPVWNHLSAFFYGFIIGYVVVKQIRINMSAKTIQRIWMIVVPLGFVSIYAPYFWNHYKRPIYKWQMVLYVLFDRSILLTTCAWLAYASMVLARPPRPKKTPQKTLPADGATNLPEIVTLANDKGAPAPETDKTGSSNTLAVAGCMKRQRSSPNFLSSRSSAGDVNLSTLRPAVSTADLSAANKQQKEEGEQQQQVVPDDQAKQQRSNEQRRSSAPVSNVNILCLVLSRLTFQLYLFNMVVLWVDVTNSKYFWYFSYYFIITKAFAVYIASTLMAMIFFVLLESPCLTLYITWVKRRAHQRANRMKANQSKDDDQVNRAAHQDLPPVTQLQTPANNDEVRGSPSSSLADGRSTKSPDSGLHMKTMSKLGAVTSDDDKPTFSFIDLSAPSSDQTKM